MKGVLKTRLLFLAVIVLLVVALPVPDAFAHSNYVVAGSAVQQPDLAQQGYYSPDYPWYGPKVSPDYQPNYDWYNGGNYGSYGSHMVNMGMGWGCW